MSKYLTVQDIADRWAVSTDVVYDYIAEGRLLAVKIGRSWRIKPGDLEKFEKQKLKEDQEMLKNRRLVRV